MTDQSRLQFTDALIERMLVERAGPGAPPELVLSITAAVESTGQRAPGLVGALSGPTSVRRRRGPRRTWLLAATVLVGTGVVGASFIGGRLVTPKPVPTMPALVTNPTAVPKMPSWAATGDMVTPRGGHTATLLRDGKVLVAGGAGAGVGTLASAELYDPRTGSWTAVGSMHEARELDTATLLPDGKVLVAGGYRVSDGKRVGLASAEVYDPSTRSWTATGSMDTPRFLHAATLLPDGKVLVAGGDSGSVTLASAELYDSSTGSWAAAGSMHEARAAHAAVLLSDGKVLVAGGADFHPDAQVDIASAELYDLGTGSWTAAGGSRHSARAATQLRDGRVLAGSDLYDPGTGSWTATRSGDNDGPATLLRDGRVLIGGRADGVTELFDPGSGSWTRTASMVAPGPGALHTATLLPDGRVLVAGGNTPFTPTASAELYDPGTPSDAAWQPTP